MGFIGTNPRRNSQLDGLRRAVVDLAGIPAPLPEWTASMPTDGNRAELLKEISRELAVPRADREAIMLAAVQKLRNSQVSIFGTVQTPFMVELSESLFTTFALDLMDVHERYSFQQNWRLRGLAPAKLEARKDGRYWTYYLIENWSIL